MAAQRDAGSQLSRVCTAPNQRRHPLDRRPPPALPLAALISSTVAAVVGAVMTGLQYSELANWDGRVSIASASGGNAFTPDRELESPLPSGSSPSSRPCAGSLSSSESQRAGAVVQGDVCHKDLCAPPTAALPSPPSAIGAPPAKTKDAPMDMDVDSSDTAEERVYAGQDRMIVDNGTHDASAAVVTDAVEAHGRYSPPFTPGASQRTVTPLPRSAEDSSTARMGTEKEADAHLSSVHAFKNMGFTAAVMSRSSDTPQPHPQEPTPPQSAGVSPPRTASSPAPDQPDEDSHDPLAAEEEASSLLDADGETDNESTTSYHVVPLPTASQSSTTPKTAASSEQQMAIQNAPSHGRHKKASQGTISDEHRHITQVVDPGPIASTSKLPSHTPPRTIRPSEKAQAGAIAPRRKTPLFVDSPPPTPPLGISERANPYKRRKLNYAYVEIPPLPAGRRRAGYRPAATILVPQDPVGDDYASQLGQVLNHASIINARGPIVSASPMPKRRGRPPKSKTAALSTVSQKKNARQTKSVSVAPSAVSARSIDGSASVSKVIPRKRGRLPKVKDEHQASEAPVPNVDGIPPEVQEEAQDQSLRSEKSPEVQPRLDHPADSLETLIPSTPIDIGMYPVPSLTTDMVAYRHLLEVNPAPPSPPRSPQLNRDWVLEGWPPAPVHAVWAYHFWPPAPPPLPFACPMPVPEPVATEKSTEVSSKPQGETSPRRSTSPNSSSTAPSAAPGVDALAPRYAAYPHMPYSYGFPYLYPYPHPFPLAAAAGTPTCEPDAAAQKALPMLPLPESRPASAPHDPAAHPSPSSSPSPPPLPRSPSASPQAMVTKAQVSSPAHSSLSPSRSAALGEVVAPIPPHRRSPLLNFAPGANEEPASVTVSRVDVTQKEPALSHEHSAGPTTLLAGTAAPSGPLTASSSCNSAQPMDQNSQPVVRAPEKLSEALAIPPSSQETRTPLSDAISKPETDPHSFDYSDAMNMDMLADLGPSPSPPPGMTPDNSNSTSNGVSSDAPQSPARQQDAHSTSTAVTNVNASDHHGTTAGLIATSGTSTLTSQSYRQFQYSPELLREIAASVKKRSPKPNGHEHRGGPSA
ncbi:hypothetical protein C8Q80DRAFT_118483 [Daedaleopsis nitida]|nr:hypothetical protein C8Q80DRAFT_118483 [Daedaleopsis nitida]